MLKSSAWELGTKPQREIALFSVAFNESLNFFYMSVRSRNAGGGGGRHFFRRLFHPARKSLSRKTFVGLLGFDP